MTTRPSLREDWRGADFVGIVWRLARAVVLLILVALCVAAPWIAPYSFTEQDLTSTLASSPRIIVRHILPNVIGPVIVNLTLTVAAAILLESALSFLGLCIQPPTPTWGNMLAGSNGYVQTASWLVWFPGLLILTTVLCVNFLGGRPPRRARPDQ